MEAAQNGNIKAQSYLGTMYLVGLGVDKNYKEAIKWLLNAAEKGDIPAQYTLGSMYKNGHEVTVNFSIHWSGLLI